MKRCGVFSRVTGAQFIYPHEFGKATGINPVVGRYTVSEALAVLLHESGLSGGLTESGMIVISLRQNEGAAMRDQIQEFSTTQHASTGKRSLFKGIAAFVLGGLAGAAQAQDDEPSQLEEIIVTAQKRAQSLSDVSLSVSAVGADTLANSQTSSIEGLQFLVPSISFGNDFNFAKLFIRGIGLNSSFPGADPSVALHVDGAVIAQARRADGLDVRPGEGRGATRAARHTVRPQRHRRRRQPDHGEADRLAGELRETHGWRRRPAGTGRGRGERSFLRYGARAPRRSLSRP